MDNTATVFAHCLHLLQALSREGPVTLAQPHFLNLVLHTPILCSKVASPILHMAGIRNTPKTTQATLRICFLMVVVDLNIHPKFMVDQVHWEVL